MKKHLETNFFKFLIEKYKEEINELEEITPEESNLTDEELIDEVEETDKKQSQHLPQSQSQNEIEDDEIPNEKLVEKIFNLISKKSRLKNGSIRRK